MQRDTGMPRRTEPHHESTHIDIQRTASIGGRLTQDKETRYACVVVVVVVVVVVWCFGFWLFCFVLFCLGLFGFVFCELEPNLDISGQRESHLRNCLLRIGL